MQCKAMQCNAMQSCKLANTYIIFHSYIFMYYCFLFLFKPVDRLPDVLKAESYAFVALPAEAFWDGQVNSENIKKGILCPIRDLPKTGWIHGITLFSKVCRAITSSTMFFTSLLIFPFLHSHYSLDLSHFALFVDL